MARHVVSPALVGRVRNLSLLTMLEQLHQGGVLTCTYDKSFRPLQDAQTRRVFVSPAMTGFTFELLLTSVKWFDTRAQKGGGGAIDLYAHLFGTSFVVSVQTLSEFV